MKKLIYYLISSALLLGYITFSACNGSRNPENEKVTIQTNQLVGTWEFISLAGKSSKGEVFYPYSENLFGRLMYDAKANMSALLMNPDRPLFASGDMKKGTPEEIKAAFEGFDAYCGTYILDMEKKTVTHHVFGSKFPNWVGTDQFRFFKISGDTLHITGPPILAGDVQWDLKAVLVKL